MKLTPAQSQIAKSKHRFRVVLCGRRFGKTTLAIWEMVAKAVSKSGQRVVYVAPTYQQARDIAWQELRNITKDLSKQTNESRLEVEVTTQDGGTSLIALRGWESIETLRGTRNDFIVLDEVAMYRNWWTQWQEVIRPTLTDTRGEALFISTPKGFNHFYDLYNEQDKDPDYQSFHFTSYDNPHLPQDELEKAKEELTEDRFAQEYLADFRKTEGLVYKEFDRERHTFTGDIDGIEYFAGIDFGFTNPAAVIHIKRDKDNNYWVTDEWYQTRRTEAEIAEYVYSCGFNRCYPDPASASAIQTLQDKGVSTIEVNKGKDSIKHGIDVVRDLFKQNRLKVHKDCTNLIWELETYSYPDRKPDKNEYEDPIKENDHALDALRYALMTVDHRYRNEAEERAEALRNRLKYQTNQAR